MEKIKLNDGTILEIQSGATEYNIQIQTESVDNVANKFTDANLERYEILAENDAVCAIFTKKYLKKLSAERTENGFLVTIILEDVNELYERMKSLEATVESLQAKIEAAKKEAETEIDENETVLDENETEVEETQTEIVEDSANEPTDQTEVIEEPTEELTE